VRGRIGRRPGNVAQVRLLFCLHCTRGMRAQACARPARAGAE